MDILVLTLAISSVMWYVIDRFKTEFWAESPYGKWITIGCAAIAGFGLTFAYGLDIVLVCGLVEEASLAGKILTGFTLMSGSSAISEIVVRIKGE